MDQQKQPTAAVNLVAMRARLLLLAAAVLVVFCTIHASASQDLLRVWSAQNSSVRERAEAVNRSFTDGTPILKIVGILGANYSVLRPFSAVWIGPGPEPRKTCSLLYRFGKDHVTIGTSAAIDADPLTGEFTGAGYSLPVSHTKETTNQIRIVRPEYKQKQSR